MTRTSDLANRAMALASGITAFAVLVGIVGVIGGIVIAAQSGVGVDSGGYATTTHPYVAIGIAIALTALVEAVFLAMVSTYVQMRASDVLDGVAAGNDSALNQRTATTKEPTKLDADDPTSMRSPDEKSAFLTARQEHELMSSPPPESRPGWYPNPFSPGLEERAWDGSRWLARTRPRRVRQSTASPGPSARPPASTVQTTAPGWYDDGSGRTRWWDGTAWTDQQN